MENTMTSNNVIKKRALSDDFPIPDKAEWRAAAEALLKGRPFDKVLKSELYEGISLDPIYLREDLPESLLRANLPGFPPYLRGSRAAGYHPQGWLIAQEIQHADSSAWNELARAALDGGQNCLYAILPDSLNTDSFADLFHGLDLRRQPLFLRWPGLPEELVRIVVAYIMEQGYRAGDLDLTIDFDPYTRAAHAGGFSIAEEALQAQLYDYCQASRAQSDNWRPLVIAAHEYGDAGADTVLESAIGMAIGVAYLRYAAKSASERDWLVSKMRMSIAIGSDFFVQIARIRALRMVWQQIVDSFAANPAPLALHGRSSNINKSHLDGHSNLLRTASEGFAGICAGLESLHLGPWQRPHGNDIAQAQRLARNQQIILRDEANLKHLIDPAGGSYFVENLTDKLARRIWQEFQAIEEAGGIYAALSSGFLFEKIDEIRQKRLLAAHKRRDIFVGINDFINPESPASEVRSAAQAESVTVEKRLHPLRLAADFEALQIAAHEFGQQRGHELTALLAAYGAVSSYRHRSDFCRSFLSVGGFQTTLIDEQESVAALALAATKSNADVIVLCAADKEYDTLIPAFVPAVRKIGKQAVVLLAGLPAGKEESYRIAGIDDFIHLRANARDFLCALQEKCGVSHV
jgi:methylmalonyl-CoA mutase